MTDTSKEPFELSDDLFHIVAGGQITYSVGSYSLTSNSMVTGIQANFLANGGVGNTNVVEGGTYVFMGNQLGASA